MSRRMQSGFTLWGKFKDCSEMLIRAEETNDRLLNMAHLLVTAGAQISAPVTAYLVR